MRISEARWVRTRYASGSRRARGRKSHLARLRRRAVLLLRRQLKRRYPHPPSAGSAWSPPSPAVRERSSKVVGLRPLSRNAGEGGERSETGEGLAAAQIP